MKVVDKLILSPLLRISCRRGSTTSGISILLFLLFIGVVIVDCNIMKEDEISYQEGPPLTIPPKEIKEKHQFNLKIEILAGTLAGITSCLAFYPLECLEAKLQVAAGKKKLVKGGSVTGGMTVMEQVKQIIRQEGVKGFYQGVTPTVIGNAVNWGVYFAIYRFTNHWFSQTFPTSSPTLGHSLSAIHAGVVTTAIVNPFWVLKIRLATSNRYNGMVDALKSIVRNEGVGGLWKGVGPSFIGVSEGLVQFVTYEKILDGIRERNMGNISVPNYLAAGAAARLTAGVLTYPYLLLRSTLQSDNCQYKSIGDAISKIYKTEGYSGFYRGLVPNLVRSVPPAAMMLYIVEFFRGSLFSLIG